MSDGDSLRAAIRANPSEATARLVYADWLDENAQPGGDLVRLLVESPFWEACSKVLKWFHRNHGWPVCERVAVLWLEEALALERWPDSERRRVCLAAIATRMVPFLRRGLSGYRPEELVPFLLAAQPNEKPSAALDQAMGEGVSRTAARVAEQCLSSPGDDAGDAANQEYCEQVHVVAWVWLDLPPLRPAPNPVPGNGMPALPEPLPATPDRRSWLRRLFRG